MTDVIADKYEIVGTLGEGGTGIVYDAIRLADRTHVALKVIHPTVAGDRQVRGRFQREAAILRRLEGPHVCPILDFGEAQGDSPDASVLYIALPKIDGPSLAEVLRKEKRLPLDRALDLMIEVLAALRSAHAQGVIHRDLKPANVLMRDGEHVVVVDFGMSKIVTGTGVNTTNLTTHNMVFGTPEYMSPEQARGDELDLRCDVYAAGVMLYEMLTGDPPFTGDTPLVILTKHLTSELEPPSRHLAPGALSPAIEAVILHAVARERDERYPSAAAFSAAITHARAAPDDLDAVAPGAFATSPSGTDAFATTMPAIETVLSDRPVAAIVKEQPAVAGDAGRGGRDRNAAEPSPTSGSASGERGPSSGGPSSGGPSSGGKGSTSGSTPRSVSSSGARKLTPLGLRKSPSNAPGDAARRGRAPVDRAWLAVWIVVGLASVGAGIYLALR